MIGYGRRLLTDGHASCKGGPQSWSDRINRFIFPVPYLTLARISDWFRHRHHIAGVIQTVDVALFVTCLTDTFHPRVGVAVVRVLRHLGYRVQFPPDQACCGQPAYNNGFHDEAACMGRRFIDAFEGYGLVVTPSASCANMVKHHLPELLANDHAYAAGARALAGRCHEFGQFLKDVVEFNPAKAGASYPHSVTLHYSCHTRGIATVEETEVLVKALPDVDYRPLSRMGECCGFGGAFGVLYPQISNAMSCDKASRIVETGAEVAVVNESGCSMTIEGTARRCAHTVRFAHVAEVIAESLGLMSDYPPVDDMAR